MESTQQLLGTIGLNDSDIAVYFALINAGEIDVTTITAKTTLSRTTVHDALNTLQGKKLITHRKVGRRALYAPTHPQRLQEIVEEKKQEQRQIANRLSPLIDQLTASFHLAVGKPGMRMYEGEQGIREALWHSLQSGGPVYSYINSEVIDTLAKSIDDDYVQERTSRNIQKQMIMVDSPAAREYTKAMNQDLTAVKMISAEQYPFDASMEIYPGAVSYFSIQPGRYLAFIIEQPDIAKLHMATFKALWDQLETGDSKQ